MIFHFVMDRNKVPAEAVNAVYLIYDSWDDYGFRTTFGVSVFDEKGTQHDLPRFNIGFAGQTTSVDTYTLFKEPFNELTEGFFSLCGSVDFYRTLYSDFTEEWREEFLRALKDLVRYPELLESVKGEEVVRTSLLRSVRIDEVKDQFASVLRGEIILTNFDFGFELPQSEKFAGFDLQFKVKASSMPSTNMHALIGRNGVGKTTYLNAMVKAVSPHTETDAEFYTNPPLFGRRVMDPATYFGSLISVAFSAFDPFDQPPLAEEEKFGLQYSYVGLIDHSQERGPQFRKRLKSDEMLHEEFLQALEACFADRDRKTRWGQAIATLESDDNFSDMKLQELAVLSGEDLRSRALNTVERMSSGHTIVILSITLLVARVNEKTLVLFDEPESHLQPPLLSALMRSLAQLLKARNAVAIIATHSPVVLQEIPKSCVWKVTRLKLASTKARPEIETFGENVGTLTRDVFGLDVAKSGFHTILAGLVKAHNPKKPDAYDAILQQLGGNLGYEAKGILKAMIANHLEQKSAL
jgi:hypothetical protein